MDKVIALLTDFGLQDHYVGVMKAVIAGISPDTRIIDITHDIEPQNIKQAAFIIKASYKYFPKGTIFVIIVDPGVGSERDAVCVKTKDYYFVVPNNGVLQYALKEQNIEKVIELNNHKYHLVNNSSTFHGRDIFAPVAAHLASGKSLDDLGTDFELGKLLKIPDLKLIKTENTIEGEIIYADRFGNLISSIHENDLPESPKELIIKIGKYEIRGISKTYSDVQTGEMLAYIGSSGYLEIGIREGNCKEFIKDKYPRNISQIIVYI